MVATSSVLLLWYFIIVVAVKHLACLSCPPPSTRYQYDYLFTYIHESFPHFAKSTQKPQPERLAPARSFSLAMAPYR
ncbi:hypothetical protein QBC45DRAFT_165704 [Copromyces sp. CBS 386.78]|nr:hypothetical protein QBC45DRAFT_165704 [Copromyces sp. CBS 386.78]